VAVGVMVWVGVKEGVYVLVGVGEMVISYSSVMIRSEDCTTMVVKSSAS
jgi:hypothetical protein